MSVKIIEPLLAPDDNRFVMFPIKHNDIWEMYKKQVDCFWRAEEIDLTKDLKDWDDDTLLSKLKLIKKVTENYTAMDVDNKVKVFEDSFEILSYYVSVKLDFLQQRKD